MDPESVIIGGRKLLVKDRPLYNLVNALKALPSPFGANPYIGPAKIAYKEEPFHKSILSTLAANEAKLRQKLPENEKGAVIKGVKTAYRLALLDEGEALDITGIGKVVSLLSSYLYQQAEYAEADKVLTEVIGAYKNKGLYEQLHTLMLEIYESFAATSHTAYMGQLSAIAEALTPALETAKIDVSEYNKANKTEEAGDHALEFFLADGFARHVHVHSQREDFRLWLSNSSASPEIGDILRRIYRRALEDKILFENLWSAVEQTKLFSANIELADPINILLETELVKTFNNPTGVVVHDAYLIPYGMQGHTAYISGGKNSIGTCNSSDSINLIMRNRATGFTSLISITMQMDIDNVIAAIRHFKAINQGQESDYEVVVIGAAQPIATPEKNLRVQLFEDTSQNIDALSSSQICVTKVLRACCQEGLEITGAHLFDETMPGAYCVKVTPGDISIELGMPKQVPEYFDVYVACAGLQNEDRITDIAFDERNTPDQPYNPLYLTQNNVNNIDNSISQSRGGSIDRLRSHGFTKAAIPVLVLQTTKLGKLLDVIKKTCVMDPSTEFLTGKTVKLGGSEDELLVCVNEATKGGAIGAGAEVINDSKLNYVRQGRLYVVTEGLETITSQAPEKSYQKKLEPKTAKNKIVPMSAPMKKGPPVIMSGRMGVAAPTFGLNPMASQEFSTAPIREPVSHVSQVRCLKLSMPRQNVLGMHKAAADAAMTFNSIAVYTGGRPKLPPTNLGTKLLDEVTFSTEPAAAKAK